ncbi:MAG TPA: acetoin utilization protein AcuC [Micromonosporaceae bacterium]
MLQYDLGDHPLNPVRVELTIALARGLGVLDRSGVRIEAPVAADDAALTRVHHPAYLAAVRAAPDDPFFSGWGLGTGDNPIFDGMHEASALVAGATMRAAEAVWRGEARRALNIAGGLHHAMPARASGFCVYNDPAVAITRLLDLGADRVAYVDIDVHHGDGVQEIFYNDPRVLTISLHETPLALFPGTGFPDETGGPDAAGSAVNVALPPGTDDNGWLRAFHAVVPSVLRAFRPQVLFTQCGADTYQHDPLADLRLSVDGQRASYLALRDLAEEICEGRWIATGGGGYALFEAVPRAWTHLLAIATGDPLEPATPTPAAWQRLARQRLDDGNAGRRARLHLVPNGPGIPVRLTDDADPTYRPWQPTDSDAVDRAIMATRREVFPLLGLDPHDPRD